MSETQRPIPDAIMDLIAAALDDLSAGILDGDLPSIDEAHTERERELIGRLREVFAVRRRVAQRLRHIAAATITAVRDSSDRIAVTANANAEVTASAQACDASATALSETARGVRNQANELHALIESVAEATSNLAESGRDVTRDSDTLSAAVGDVAGAAAAIASSMKDIDRAMGGLTRELSTTAGAVTAINTSIRSIDAGTAETFALSGQMSEAAANGIDIVRQTAEAVDGIATAVTSLGRSMEQLVERSEEVSEITKIIQGIAVQAKLLALNASIQAAHAGDAGRGFAVVAREIKQLSDSTTASTREIETVVRSIRGEIGLASQEARASGERAVRGLQLAHAASSALDAIYAEAELIRTRVEQISDATSTQTSETANLKRAMGRVAELAERLRRTATERNESSQKVVGRVREISTLAYRVRQAMGEQEEASLGIVAFIERLISVAAALEAAVDQQTGATEELASAISHIYEAGRESQVSVAAMTYANGLIEQSVEALRSEISQVRLPKPARGGRISVPLTIREVDLDPVRGFSESHTTVLDCVFETLVSSREGGRITPSLAERWEVSPDGLTWTFTLRKGVRFHHGREMTSDDVVFSLKRVAAEAKEGAFLLASVRGAREYMAGTATTVEGIRARGQWTVEIELVEPIAFFLGLVALTFASIVPRDAFAADPAGFATKPVGTGPFVVRSISNDRIVLDRNADYRDNFRPYLDGVDFLLDVGSDEALDGVMDGRFAYTRYIPRLRLPQLLEDAVWRSQIQSITQPHCQYLIMNHREGRLPDSRTRRALAHAIDREKLVRAYSPAPVAVTATGLVPPSCPGYDSDLRLPDYDPVRARALLDESGYDRSRPIDLVLTDAPWTIGDEAVSGIRDDLAAIGLRLEPRIAPFLNQTRRDGDFDLIEASWYGDYLDPDTFTFGAFHSQLGSFTHSHDCETLDGLLELARATTDPPSRDELYREVHRTFVEVCPAIVLLHRRDYIVHSQAVEGLQLYPILPTVRPIDLWLTGHARG